MRDQRSIHGLVAVGLVAMLLAGMLVGGCTNRGTPSGPSTRESKAGPLASLPATGTHVLHPKDVKTSVRDVALTIAAVYAHAPDTVVGVVTYPQTSNRTAPAGSRLVDVVVKVDDSTRKYQKLGARFFGAPTVLADSTRLSLVSREWEGIAYDTSKFSETMQFAVPVDTKSAVLEIPLSLETSEVVKFRLW